MNGALSQMVAPFTDEMPPFGELLSRPMENSVT
jgi:hypothetical protein